MSKENTTNTTVQQNTGISDEDWAVVQNMLAKTDEEIKLEELAKRAAQAKARRKVIKRRKQRRIASIFNWINAFLTGSFIFQFVIKFLDYKFPEDDASFFAWFLFIYIILVAVFGSVGEYIGERINDKG